MIINNAIQQIMKHIIKSITAGLLAISVCACSTTQKITINGTSGSRIYTPSGDNLGTIPESGKLKVALSDGYYYPYLLSQPQGADYKMPFALNFEHCNHTGTKISRGVGYGLTMIGCGVTLVGAGCMIAAAASDDEDNTTLFGTITGIGAGVAGVGAAIGAPAGSRLEQVTYEYKFKYLKNQYTNDDLVPRPLAPYGVPKTSAAQQAKAQNTSATAVENSESASVSVARRQLSERSTKTLRDYGSQVSGSYTGSGKLMLGKEVIEQYANIRVVIERVGKEEVSVKVIEANGNEFFPNGSTYSVKKNSNSSYSLKHENVSTATISIDKAKKLVYLHPRVNIDGDIYTLQITATLQ